MALQHQLHNVLADASWQLVHLNPTLTPGQYLTILPAFDHDTYTGRVPAASRNEVNTGIVLTPGQRITIAASGTWYWELTHAVGPEGDGQPSHNEYGTWRCPNQSQFSLVGNIGTDAKTWFFIGSAYSAVVSPDTEGVLYLAMNDLRGRYGNRSGSLAVTVTVESPPLLARIGGGTPFVVGRRYAGVVTETGHLELASERKSVGSFKTLVLVDTPQPRDHDAPGDYSGEDESATNEPIEWRTGSEVLAEAEG